MRRSSPSALITDEGQRVGQGKCKHLQEKPYGDQPTGPSYTALQQCCGHFPFTLGVQKVASFRVLTSCTVSWQPLEMQDN